jgi:hypothetical protein
MEPRRDAGEQSAQQLAEIRRIFEEADKVYRYLRASIQAGKWPGSTKPPIEWIPLSEN